MFVLCWYRGVGESLKHFRMLIIESLQTWSFYRVCLASSCCDLLSSEVDDDDIPQLPFIALLLLLPILVFSLWLGL